MHKQSLLTIINVDIKENGGNKTLEMTDDNLQPCFVQKGQVALSQGSHSFLEITLQLLQCDTKDLTP